MACSSGWPRSAGATHIAVNAVGRDVDLERFVKFTAREVAALIP
jgi:hypothetical protein